MHGLAHQSAFHAVDRIHQYAIANRPSGDAWTDRGNLPRGNTVNRAEMDNIAATSEVVLEGLDEGIGLSLDLPNNRMFFTDIGGNLYSANLDGSGERELLHHAGGPPS